MNSTGIVDKVYLALELTKIRYNGLLNADTTDIGTDKNVIDTFLYYIEELTGISIEEIDNIPKLEEKLEDITSKYKMLRDTFDVRLSTSIRNNNKSALELLEKSKGDMEQYVYKNLKDALTKN